MKKKTLSILGALLLSVAALVLVTGCTQPAGGKKEEKPSIPAPPPSVNPMKDTVWKLSKVKGASVAGGTDLYIYFIGDNAELKLAKKNGGTKNKSNKAYPYYTEDTDSKITCTELGFNKADLELDINKGTIKISVNGAEKVFAAKESSVTVTELEGSEWAAADLTGDFKE